MVNLFRHNNLTDEVWSKVEQFVSDALSCGPLTYAPKDVRDMVDNRNIEFWTAHSEDEILGFCAFNITQYPLAKVCEIYWVGGKNNRGDEWLSLLGSKLEEWAKTQGVTRIGGAGRPGWGRKLGLKPIGVILEKEL